MIVQCKCKVPLVWLSLKLGPHIKLNPMKRYLIISIFLSVLILSCKKELPPVVPVSPFTSGSYFIEGMVDGVLVRADYVCGFSGCAMNAGNYSDFMEWLTMQRTVSASDDKGWSILIGDVILDSWVVPDTLDASSLFDQENLDLSYYSGPWVSDNNYLVDGVVLGDSSFQLIVTSKSGDVIEGTFSGQLRNGSDTSNIVTVTNGKFRIKIMRV